MTRGTNCFGVIVRIDTVPPEVIGNRTMVNRRFNRQGEGEEKWAFKVE